MKIEVVFKEFLSFLNSKFPERFLGMAANEYVSFEKLLKDIFESRKYSNQKVVTKAKINQDGTIESDIYQQIKGENYLDPNNYQYKIAIDNVKRALELCSPIRNIPSNITEQLQDLIFEFEGN